jgi:SNF2 family DNA or RNA helicase
MNFKPYNYQKECISFLNNTPKAGLFLDMGMGKTGITLSAIKDAMYDYWDCDRVLIIAPLRVVLIAWPSELQKWSEFKDIPYTILHGPQKEYNLRSNAKIFLINYDGLRWLNSKNEEDLVPQFDMVVLDESTFIKNSTTLRYKIIKKLFYKAKRKVILTGTPAPNGLLNLYGQISFLDDQALGRSFYSFRNNFFTPVGRYGYKWVPRRGTTEIINKKVAPLVKILKAKDYLDMPGLNINEILVDLPEKKREEYKKLERDFFLELESGESVTAFNAASLSMKLRQYVQGFIYKNETSILIHDTKLNVLKELLESAAGNPILCAVQFIQDINMIQSFFSKMKIPAVYSKTKGSDSTKYIKQWNAGKIPLLLTHPASMGHGLNLQTGGHTVVWFGITWSLEQHDQLNCRLYRNNQENTVIINYIIMRKTVDEAIMSALRDNATTQANLIQSLRRYRDESRESSGTKT